MPNQPPGHDYRTPVPDDTKALLQELARVIGNRLTPHGLGFTLLLFEFNKDPGTSDLLYISNAQRADVVKTMQEFIAKQANG